MNTRKGFTLIELLIVVAIIAILALIAVPNFLEAQTRARVARVNNDMRSMATAIESYHVDHNNPPLGQVSFRAIAPAGVTPPPDMTLNRFWNIYAQSKLTTPIAYMTSIPLDPFIDVARDVQGRREYVYHDYVWEGHTGAHKQCYVQYQYTWAMQSRGPSRQNVGGIQSLLTSPNPRIYDPTNGTVSYGSIVRSNKGIYKGPAGK